MPRIWGRASAFNVQKVMWAIGEIGRDHERIDLGGAFGGLDSPLFRAMNPNGRIPVIEQKDLADLAQFQEAETGYQRIQGTKPQTLGFGLNDSPAGLAAWITEKFRTWSDCDGNPENVYTKDELLTNITVYWVTQTITSSTRLYYEVMGLGGSGAAAAAPQRLEVPTGVARFPREILRFPRKWVEASYNVVHWTDMPKGGHFAAMEQPELFVDDVRKFFRRFR